MERKPRPPRRVLTQHRRVQEQMKDSKKWLANYMGHHGWHTAVVFAPDIEHASVAVVDMLKEHDPDLKELETGHGGISPDRTRAAISERDFCLQVFDINALFDMISEGGTYFYRGEDGSFKKGGSA